jgi:hypothetical protein
MGPPRSATQLVGISVVESQGTRKLVSREGLGYLAGARLRARTTQDMQGASCGRIQAPTRRTRSGGGVASRSFLLRARSCARDEEAMRSGGPIWSRSLEREGVTQRLTSDTQRRRSLGILDEQTRSRGVSGRCQICATSRRVRRVLVPSSREPPAPTTRVPSAERLRRDRRTRGSPARAR